MKLSKHRIQNKLIFIDYTNLITVHCKILFKSNDNLCRVCNTQRFKNIDGSITKKMKSFFYIRDLKDIQKTFFKGKININ